MRSARRLQGKDALLSKLMHSPSNRLTNRNIDLDLAGLARETREYGYLK
jgi:hypothetical protein